MEEVRPDVFIEAGTHRVRCGHSYHVHYLARARTRGMRVVYRSGSFSRVPWWVHRGRTECYQPWHTGEYARARSRTNETYG
jgi:hypothetical protein